MHANPFDRYREGHSFLHSLDPRVKLLFTLTFIISTALLPEGAWFGFALSWLLLLSLNHLGRLGWSYTLKHSIIALPFAMAAISVIFTLPGQPVSTIQLGPFTLTPTDAGLLRFASILARSWLSVQAAILLAATTPFPDVAHAMRHLKVPTIFVSVMAFMFRYLFVLADEAVRLMRARAARSARLPGTKSPPLLWRAQVTGNMAGQLFLRGYERAERVYNAMLARGYTGQFLTLNPHHIRTKDWASLSLALALLLAFQFVAHYSLW